MRAVDPDPSTSENELTNVDASTGSNDPRAGQASLSSDSEVNKVFGEQLELALEWGREPWKGQSPRVLTRGFRVRLHRTCVVDKSEVSWASREAQRFGMDPAQYMCFIFDGAS